jgi:toxin ParE1/3/4
MATFTLTRKAKEDMLAIGRYTRKHWGATQQNHYLSLLDSAFHDLANKRAIGQPCTEIRTGYFKYHIGKHLIFYRHIAPDQIEIVRILHGRMDISRHL